MPVALEKWGNETVTSEPGPFAGGSALAPLRGQGFVAAYTGESSAITEIDVYTVDPLGSPARESGYPFFNRIGGADVAALANGNFVVAATRVATFAGPNVSEYAVYRADGTVLTSGAFNDSSQLAVNTGAVALSSYGVGDASDRFLAVFFKSNGDGLNGNGSQNPGLRGQFVLNDGTSIGSQFSINTSTAGEQSQADVAAVSGGAVVVWTDFGVNAGDIRFRILADTGPVVPETTVNPNTAGIQRNPAVATLSDGRFVVVWEDNSNAFDANGQGITGRIFNRDGTVSVESFAVNTITAGNQSAPRVTALQDGGFVVAFNDPSGAGDVYARTFDASGNALGAELRINTTVAGQQSVDDITTLEDGRVVVSFTDLSVGQGRVLHQIGDTRVGDLVGDEEDNFIVGRQTGQSNPNDHIFGFGGNDKIFGVGGADVIDAGEGNDSVEGGAGADTLIGGPGTDRANYVLSSAGVSVSLLTGTGSGGDAEGDTLSGFEDLIGSAFADTLTGDGGVNVLNGRQGGDVLRGAGGADRFGFDELAFLDAFENRNGFTPAFDRIADYNQGNSGSFSSGEGDVVDLSLFTPLLSINATNGTPLSSIIRLVEDASGLFADLQVDIDGSESAFRFTTVVRLDGLHPGDGVNVILSTSQPAGVTIKVPGFLPASDFNDDAFSDILLQSSGGGTGLWLMNGPNIQSAYDLPPLPAGWNVIGNADFNGDGRSDILLGTPGGALGLWQMNGPTIQSAYDLPSLPAGWHVVGDGDFGGDGKSDILLQSDSGGVGMWQMNGGQIAFANDLPPMPQGWHIAGVGDFGGDGKSDIILQSDGGGVGLWQMSGAQISKATDLPPLPSGWSIEDVGDFNADRRSDVLLSTAGGALGIWLMNGPSIQSAHDLPALPAGWEVAGLVDVGGDGRSDILLQNGSGGVGLWQMNGPTIQSVHDLPSLPAGWHIAAYQYDLV